MTSAKPTVVEPIRPDELLIDGLPTKDVTVDTGDIEVPDGDAAAMARCAALLRS